MKKRSKFFKAMPAILLTAALLGGGVVYGAEMSDVPGGHWAKDAVDFALALDLLPPTSETTFSPGDATSRGEYISALGKLTEADVSGYGESGFSDVADSDPSMPYIEWASEAGIVSGMGGGRFAPDNEITREQMAVMMKNTADYLSKGPVGGWMIRLEFEDLEDVSDWAFEGVAYCFMNDVMTGKPGNLFDPKGNVTRAEAASILQRFNDSVLSKEPFEPLYDEEYADDELIEEAAEGQDPVVLARSFAASVAARYGERLNGEWADKHDEMISSGEGPGSEYYNELLDLLGSYAEEIGVRSMYLMIVAGEQEETAQRAIFTDSQWLEITVDSLMGLEAFGVILAYGDVFDRVINGAIGFDAAEEDAWIDENRDIFISAYSAVYNSEGQFSAFLGIDYPAPEFAEFPEYIRD